MLNSISPSAGFARKQCLPSARTQQTYSLTWKNHHPSVFSEIVPTASCVPRRKQATLVEVVEKAKKYNKELITS